MHKRHLSDFEYERRSQKGKCLLMCRPVKMAVYLRNPYRANWKVGEVLKLVLTIGLTLKLAVPAINTFLASRHNLR